MRRLTRLTVRVQRALLLTGVLLLGAVGARAQSAKGGKIDPTWLRADAASKTVEFKLVAGLSEANGGMNFNGFGRGALVLTVPQGWNVVLHFKNQDPNLPHSVEVIPDAAPMPVGPVTPAFPGTKRTSPPCPAENPWSRRPVVACSNAGVTGPTGIGAASGMTSTE